MSGGGIRGDVRPVRLAHLGLGAFFRAHQAWYTAHAPDAEAWGIAAFTGRRPDLAVALNAQDCRYTLIERHADGDRAEIVSSIAAAYAGTDLEAWRTTIASPEVGAITLTVTEAAYPAVPERDDALLADVRRWPEGAPSTVTGRILAGLHARRAADAGPLALVSCDNLPDNGAVLRHAVRWAAGEVDSGLAGWIERHVSFVSTVVDRITPASTDEDRAAAKELTCWADASPVVTEPFSEWILSGDFPAGRPGWDGAGARFVDDVEPFVRRKLWLLNGAHSLLAYAAATRGHETVADAVHDEVCVGWMGEWWDAAQRHLGLDAADVLEYRNALRYRFANPRIRHRLAQIGMDGSQKLPVRVLPVLRADLAAGHSPVGAARPIAAWIRHLRGETFEVRDPAAATFTAAASGPPRDAVRAVVSLLDEDLAEQRDLVRLIEGLVRDLG
ncbi:mannitol dehydrogenase family protein [Phytoactinopolyspora halotolerans]|uniref:Mannitol-1-phosphate 5-dehydrogenase n=2 Tax=Phytoactinopolyspora halotolerans TaxID=1981512 RepID=A0A6L9SB15_9ACTN|nr:mannitol dehydrogenase family protein [Phytoactinopolyspora halotolerans]